MMKKMKMNFNFSKKITNGCINLACKGKIKTAFGYKWKYKNN